MSFYRNVKLDQIACIQNVPSVIERIVAESEVTVILAPDYGLAFFCVAPEYYAIHLSFPSHIYSYFARIPRIHEPLKENPSFAFCVQFGKLLAQISDTRDANQHQIA